MTKKHKNLYLLKGSLNKRIRVLENIKKSVLSYELCSYDDTYGWEYIKQQILEPSCFKKFKIIVISKWPKFKDGKNREKLLYQFKKILSHIPFHSILVFNNLGISAPSFLKEVNSIGKVYEFDQEINKNIAQGRIKKFFCEYDKKIDDNNISLLLSSLNYHGSTVDVDRLSLLIKKIMHYTGSRKNISDIDVMNICMDSYDFIIWNLFSYLDNKDFYESFKLFNRLFVSYDKDKTAVDGIIIPILNMFLWRYKLLLVAKNLSHNNIAQPKICDMLSKLYKLERKGLSRRIKMNLKTNKNTDSYACMYSRNMIENIFKKYRNNKSMIESYSLNELYLINFIVINALLKIRRGSNPSETIIMVEFIIMIICKKFQNNNVILGFLNNEG